MDEEAWYRELCEMARAYGESVSDRAAWLESYYDGQSPTEAFFEEYPEHDPVVGEIE